MALYARTQYRVRLARGGHATLRIGRPLPPVLVGTLRTADTTWAFVTAWNPRSTPLPTRINRERQRELLMDLRASHSTITPGIGVSDDGNWREPSLFVAGLPFDHLGQLIRRFDQQAIVRGQGTGTAELHWFD